MNEMDHDTPEQHRSNEEMVEDLAAHVAALDTAISQADLSGATVDELLLLDGLVGETEAALDQILMHIDVS